MFNVFFCSYAYTSEKNIHKNSLGITLETFITILYTMYFTSEVWDRFDQIEIVDFFRLMDGNLNTQFNYCFL
jgi:hypothetical protein